MSVDLNKGQRLDLTKTNPQLKIAAIGLGWDIAGSAGSAFDLDAFALALKSGKLVDDPKNLLYFGSPKDGGKPVILNGALTHSGDNLTGAGDGDDETMLVDFGKLPVDFTEVLVCVNIYQAAERRQNFGMVNNAFIRIYDWDTKSEILKYDLSEDYSGHNALVMGKLYKKDGEWKFQAVGEGKSGDINAVAASFK